MKSIEAIAHELEYDRAYARKYHAAHGQDPEFRERARVRAAAWYEANYDRASTAHKTSYVANRPARIAAARLYKQAHPEEYRKSSRERRLIARAFVDAAMAGGCVDCGTKEQIVLDLDHVRGQKVAAIGALVYGSLDRLFAEIDKCETRCSNCHRRVTAERRQQKKEVA